MCKETKSIIPAVERILKSKDRKKICRKLAYEAGIITKSGKLRKPYRGIEKYL